MVRTFNGSWNGRSDYARYTLTSYNENCDSGFYGKYANAVGDLYWPHQGYGNATESVKAGHKGSGDSHKCYWCNVTFNYDELDELRDKAVKNVRLEVEATLEEYVDIDMKLNPSIKCMKRCNKNQTAISSTKLGKWYSTSPNYVSHTGGICVFDLTNDINGSFAGVPKYGYCWGRNGSHYSSNYYAKLISEENAATTSKRAYLYVITNERQSTLSFSANGGSGAPGSVTGSGPEGACVVKIPSGAPTRTNYTFKGWATSSSGSVKYQPGNNVSITANTTLYAVWSAVNVHVYYRPGTGGTGSYDSYPHAAGGTVTLIDASAYISKPGGYALDGYSSADGGEKEYSFGDTYMLGSSNATFYGHWVLTAYTIRYDANGGSSAPDAQTKTGGQTLTLSEDRPSRDGFRFLGWSLTSSGEPAYQPGDDFDIDSNTALYAVWEEFKGILHAATHEGIKKAHAYRETGSGLTRLDVYIMTEDGIRRAK